MSEDATARPRGSVIDETITRLRAAIAGGEFVAGQRLPTERALSVRLGVSRSSLREAIRALTLVGILEARQGDGTYVTDLGPSLLLDAFSMLVELTPTSSMLDLLAVRRVLEGMAATQAASRITPEQLDQLARCLETMHHDPQAGDGDVEGIVAADIRFHSIIAAAAGNPVLAALIEALGSQTFGTRLRRGFTEAGIFPRGHHEHEAIYQALRAGDPRLAGALAEAHIAAVEQFVRTSIGDGSPSHAGASGNSAISS